MNTRALPVQPDVTAFVERVAELLADLSEEDRLELVEGLEADLAEQVAEHGGSVLDDPEEYARELRVAAGFDPPPRRRLRSAMGVALLERLDMLRGWWDEQVARTRIAPLWSVVAALRPAWWVFRAWVAAVVLCMLMPGYTPWGFTWLPGVSNELGLAILAVCVVLSTLVGLGRTWPGASPAGSRGTVARLVLVGLNVLALGMVAYAEQEYQDAEWRQIEGSGYLDNSWVESVGVLNRGHQVCNIAAYDAAGRQLTGVQLFDQDGRPLDVRCHRQHDRTVPWVLGDVTRWNVFPLGERQRPARTPERRADLSDAAFPTPDRATTPEVTNPLLPPAAEEAEPPRARQGEKREKDVSRR